MQEPCQVPGCPAYASDGSTMCPPHAKIYAAVSPGKVWSRMPVNIAHDWTGCLRGMFTDE